MIRDHIKAMRSAVKAFVAEYAMALYRAKRRRSLVDPW